MFQTGLSALESAKNLRPNWAHMNGRSEAKADTEAVLLYDVRINFLDIMRLCGTQ